MQRFYALFHLLFFLSFRGDYSKKLYITHHRYVVTCFGIPTSQIWEPLMVKNTPFEMNWLGFFFAPCVYLDRQIWHKEIDVFSYPRSTFQRNSAPAA